VLKTPQNQCSSPPKRKLNIQLNLAQNRTTGAGFGLLKIGPTAATQAQNSLAGIVENPTNESLDEQSRFTATRPKATSSPIVKLSSSCKK